MKIVINTTKNILPKIILFGLFLVVLLVIIAFARGYRFNLREGTVTSTGIISINSTPRGATVYINDELTGATDTNLTLPYGEYDIEVKKEGYTSWSKKVLLKGEIVMSLNAVLFSKNPSLTPLTNIGVNTVHAVGNTDKVILISETGDLEQDGIYLFEPNANLVSLFPPLKQVLLRSLVPETVDFTSAKFAFGPQYRKAIVSFTYIDQPEMYISYLISIEDENVELFEVTNSVEDIIDKWHEERSKEMAKVLETLPKAFQPIATESFHIISLSPDEKRVMYVAKEDASLPLVIDPALIGANQTTEQRDIKQGKLYIYDKKEDKNFLIPAGIDVDVTQFDSIQKNDDQMSTKSAPTTNLVYDDISTSVLNAVRWYPTSDYIAMKEKDTISVIQYDGTNKETVYAGPFDQSYFGISPDWNLMVIINLNPQNNEYGDLYSVGIR